MGEENNNNVVGFDTKPKAKDEAITFHEFTHEGNWNAFGVSYTYEKTKG